MRNTLRPGPGVFHLLASLDAVSEAAGANGVFVRLPEDLQQRLRDKGWEFYTFVPPTGCRLMCAWDTERETVDRLLADVRAAGG